MRLQLNQCMVQNLIQWKIKLYCITRKRYENDCHIVIELRFVFGLRYSPSFVCKLMKLRKDNLVFSKPMKFVSLLLTELRTEYVCDYTYTFTLISFEVLPLKPFPACHYKIRFVKRRQNFLSCYMSHLRNWLYSCLKKLVCSLVLQLQKCKSKWCFLTMGLLLQRIPHGHG